MAMTEDRHTKGSAGKARMPHKATSQDESDCSPPDSRKRQDDGMLGRANRRDPVGHERVSRESIGRNHAESAYGLCKKTGKRFCFDKVLRLQTKKHGVAMSTTYIYEKNT